MKIKILNSKLYFETECSACIKQEKEEGNIVQKNVLIKIITEKN